MKIFFAFILIFTFSNLKSQDAYKEEIMNYILKYKRELVRDTHSPITRADLQYIDFFDPDPAYRVKCKITKLKDRKFIDFATSSGKKRKYRKYAMLTCPLKDTVITIYAYESKRLLESEQYKDYIFLPFSDLTNDESTYGGGRYIDLNRKDFAGDSIVIDFNKAYNPYCAYSYGYSCAVPPVENFIEMEIKAGEKKFKSKKKHKHHKGR